jgi:TonB-dependent receptor
MFIDTSCCSKILWGIFIALLLTFAVPSMYAQGSGSIKGSVVDSETGWPVIGANVVIENTSLGSAADVKGEFYIHYVPAGKRTIKVSSLGYAPVTKEIQIADGENLTNQIFRLIPQSITGEEVTVTAQARGQDIAINQQLASNTISNIVSADRIKELPDASAAESIGRLPGVSIDRYNGEATSIAIRGLAPKYNTVTVNGVALPSTNNNDRSVDLSLVSSNVLDGIEVKKANTADMDADALGGTIDLRLKEAPEDFQMNATLQGGYSNLNKYYGNYSGIFGVSDRFFDNKLGVIFGFNADKNNRNADKLDVAYNGGAGLTGTVIDPDMFLYNTITKRRDDYFKNRIGANLLLDYNVPYGKLTGNGFYNQAKTTGTYRDDQLYLGGGHATRYFDLDDNTSTTSLYTSSVGVMQNFGWIKYDVSVSASGSNTDDPNDRRWRFSQENNAINGTSIYSGVPVWNIDSLEIPYYNDTANGLATVYTYSTWLVENQKTVQFNIQFPFTFGNQISGSIKAGGKFKWLTRTMNQEQWGHENLQYGSATNANSQLAVLIPALAAQYPNDFNTATDLAILLIKGLGWPIARFNRGYAIPSNFLGNKYPGFGTSPDLRLMNELTDVMQTLGPNLWQHISLGSVGYDYDGIEQYQAGYIMAEINLGPYVTLIPGIRYDADWTKYHGQSFQQSAPGGSEAWPASFQYNENIRTNSYWLPNIHVKIQPFDWMRIHLAGTETVTRPDYNMYAPITSLDQYGNTCVAANGSLRDSRSRNLDASVSLTQKYLGLVAVSGFYKTIDDLVLYEKIKSVDTLVYQRINAQLNVPQAWLVSNKPEINTYINNPSPAQYRGVEFEWQTNFWYLPQPLTGLLFNINWTYITSEIAVQQFNVRYTTTVIPPHTIVKQLHYDTTSRTQRMPDQPSHIFNTTIGYEYKGFSVRASYIFQSDKVTYIDNSPALDAFTSAYDRWDIAIQQKLGNSFQLYANLNNITNTHDESLLEGTRVTNPTQAYYYGSTVDVGLRYIF